MDKLLKTIVLCALGAFLYTRVANNTILFYIHERFTLLTLLGAVGALLLGLSYYRQPPHDHTHDHHGHNHHHLPLQWWGLLIISLPVLIGLLVPPQPLGAVALLNRELNLGGWQDSSLPQVPPLNREGGGMWGGAIQEPLDWFTIAREFNRPQALNGREARLTGFVYRDDRFAPDSFLVGRFLVSCCVADAAALGVVVQWPEAEELALDQWVSVYGRLQSGELAGRALPMLVAEHVQLIAPPAQPYFYR